MKQKIIAVLMMGGAGLVGWCIGRETASAQPAGDLLKEVRANRFVLVDKNGTPRAWMGMVMGMPKLSLDDENGTPRAVLAMSRLNLLDMNGKTRIVLGVSKNGPVVGLSDENSKPRARLIASKNGPMLDLYDKNGKPIWSAPR